MATWAELKETRLLISDPVGLINLETVADEPARLLVTPAAQTGYRQEDTAEYYKYDSDLAVWERIDLELSDDRIDNLIDVYGQVRASARAVKLILAAVGRRMGIARSQGGAESITYQTLSDTYAFFKAVAESLEKEADETAGVSTGRYIRYRGPRIAGGL